jgi:hypothetical protein
MAPVRRSTALLPNPACCYRGFELIQQSDLSWTVTPLGLAGRTAFTMPPSSLADVKALIDWRLG